MIAETPIISIITVTKDNHAGLAKTAHSIANQANRANYEWIVIDGASDDGTIELLKTTDAQWVSEADNGLYHAMNKGIDIAIGDYLLFLNAGDQFANADTLAIITDTLAANVPDFLYGDALEDTKQGQFLKPAKSHERSPHGMFTHHQAMIYKRGLLNDLRYDQSYKIAADYDFTCRFLDIAQIIEYLKQPLCIFESGGVSQNNVLMGRVEQFHIRKRLKLVHFWQNHLIFVRQSFAQTLRGLFPALFWHWQKRGVSSGNNAFATTQT